MVGVFLSMLKHFFSVGSISLNVAIGKRKESYAMLSIFLKGTKKLHLLRTSGVDINVLFRRERIHEFIHLFTNALVNQLGVMCCHASVGVPHHLRDHFQ